MAGVGLFLSGFGIVSVNRIFPIIIIETTEERYRQRNVIGVFIFYGIGATMIAGTFWLVGDWRINAFVFQFCPSLILTIITILYVR